MKLVTSEQMRKIDKITIEREGIPGLELMEKAGIGSALAGKKMLDEKVKGKKVIVFCGKGNNGGDGFVVGRYLSKWGAKVEFYLLGKKEEVKGDALANLKKAVSLKLPIKQVSKDKELPAELKADLLVDAIFGTGFKGKVTGLEEKAVQLINSSRTKILSIDTPSGLDVDTGSIEGECVKANVTPTMGLPKVGQFFFPGNSYCGKIEIIDIGVPQKVIEEQRINLNLITEQEVKSILPKRPGDAHKGTCGKVFLIAGSTGMTGAATLASLSCLKAGAGMAILGIPMSLNDIMEVKVTEVMTKPLPDVRKKGALALRGLGEIMQALKWADCVALGPGLGQHFETVELVRRLVSRIELPMVIDADGLNAISKDSSILNQAKAPLILTPHIGELSRLINVPIEEIAKDRIKYASESAKKFNCVLVLKGAPTIIGEPEGEIYVNPTGNAGMATAGSGDVLTGIIIGLMAQILMMRKSEFVQNGSNRRSVGQDIKGTMLESALAGVYIHGLCGDLAQDEKGEMGMIAGDMMEKLPEALKYLVNE
ncbi:MAG: NAD(P)H-hydrate dehydratase [candidate division Zixibacteria bacterium]|nr:NAD(P)H-hydrate dehydratase [candidate division Zixibacteria bacterium]